MRITATYKDGEGDQVTVEQSAVVFYSVGDFYIHVATSTNEGILGQYAVFHLRSNFPFQNYNYVVSFEFFGLDSRSSLLFTDPVFYSHLKVVSKGLVVHGATETHPHGTKLVTFSVPVSTEMAPTFKLVAMVVNPIGDLVADSVTIPVQCINRYKVFIYIYISIRFNELPRFLMTETDKLDHGTNQGPQQIDSSGSYENSIWSVYRCIAPAVSSLHVSGG